MVHHLKVSTFRDFVDEVLGPTTVLPVLEVPITDALGCMAAVDVEAARPVPGFRNVLVDGVAILASDASAATSATPVILPIAGTVTVGCPAEPLEPGHCVLVRSGAQLPAGADCVVPASGFTVHDDKVQITRTPIAGDGFREVGSDFEAGERVVVAGQYLGHIEIAQLALIGAPRVTVHPRPRVVVITVGSELSRVSAPPDGARVHDATGVLLTTTAARLGADCYRVGPVADDPRAVRNAIEDQLVRADLVVTAGGIGAEDDVLRGELAQAGIARFDGPPVNPCGPYGVGRIGPDETPIIALPGDPAVALLAFHALARPVLAGMLGRDIYRRDAAVAPPRHAASGSRLTPGRMQGHQFIAVGAEPPSLRDLAKASALAIHHAGQSMAEVVEWPH